MIPHTGTILTPPAAHQHHTVLLDIVALAGDVGADDTPGAEPDFCRLALARVGLLGLGDADLQTHAFHLGPLGGRQRRRHRVARLLGRPSARLADLVQRHGLRSRGGEHACGRGGGGVGKGHGSGRCCRRCVRTGCGRRNCEPRKGPERVQSPHGRDGRHGE